MFIIGLFLFLFFIALLCSGIVWIAGKIGKLKGKEKEYKKYVIRKSILLIIIMLVVLIADEIVARIEFNYICKKQSGIKIYQKANHIYELYFHKQMKQLNKKIIIQYILILWN